MEAWLAENKLQLRSQKRVKRGDRLICTWDIWGSYSSHEQFVDKLLADEEIEEFHFWSGCAQLRPCGRLNSPASVSMVRILRVSGPGGPR